MIYWVSESFQPTTTTSSRTSRDITTSINAKVYRRLGYIGPKKRGSYTIEGFTVPYRDIPKQLCSPQDFRAKICGDHPDYPSIVEANDKPHGVPQGAPISDLIANFYLLDFDVAMNKFATSRGGKYMRYSDDILLIIPGGESEIAEAVSFATDEIRNYGNEVRIKESKTCAVQFERNGGALQFKHVMGPQGKNGFEYLGFRYDGRKVYVRDSTISRLYRKVAAAAKRDGSRHALRNPKDDTAELVRTFNFSAFSQRFARVKKGNLTSDYRSWTFLHLPEASITYVRAEG